MNHRHLLPDEIDLLLDDEVGFGVAPLRDHARECPDCRAALDEAQLVANVLAELPHFAPSYSLADKVMAQVPVFVPWHVAARDTALRYLPHSRPAQIAAATMAATVGGAISAGLVWLAMRGDLVVFATNVAGDHLRTTAGSSLRDAAASLFGAGLFTDPQGGPLTRLALVAGVFIVAATGSALALRAIAASARREG